MRALVVIAVLISAPLAARAQDAAPPEAPPRAPPAWSLGAGVSTGFVVMGGFIGVPITGTSLISPLSVPVANASLERRLSPRSWLVVGLSGTGWRTKRSDPAASFEARDEGTLVSASAGIRRILTGPGAPVDVSLLFLAEGGVVREEQRGVVVGALAETKERLEAWTAGGEVGLAIDRELTAGLSLRVASPLVAASYSEARTEQVGAPAGHRSDLSVRAVLAPRLELRLAF